MTLIALDLFLLPRLPCLIFNDVYNNFVLATEITFNMH